MSSFEISFRTAVPEVTAPEFEVCLALRLLDIFVGREGACYPEAVPVDGDRRLLGRSNDFWLYPQGRDRYQVAARYLPQEVMDGVAALVRHHYRGIVAGDAPVAPAAGTAGFPIAFNANIIAVAHDDFEPHLAQRLLDIFLGRDAVGAPVPPVPFDAEAGVYRIGDAIRFRPLGDRRYAVEADGVPQAVADGAAALLRYQWKHQLAVDQAA